MPQETKYCHSSAIATFPFQGSGVEVVDESGTLWTWGGSAYLKPVGSRKDPVTGLDVLDAGSVGVLQNSGVGPGARTGVACARVGGTVEDSNGVLGLTLGGTFLVKPKFWGVRAHLMNANTTQTVNVKASIGPVTDLASPLVPTSIAPFLFSGSSTVTLPVAVSGGGTSDVVPSDTVSDVLPLEALDRVDGGTVRAVNVRVYQPSAGNTNGSRQITWASGQANVATIGNCGAYNSGDMTTNAAGFAVGVTNTSLGPAIWLELIGAGRTVLGCGDSTVDGLDSTPSGNGAGNIAVREAAAAGKDVVWYNQGHSSQQSTAYLANGLKLLTTIRPAIGAFSPMSPNDSDKYTAAGVSRQMAGAVQWIQACRAVGTIPVLLTATPENSITSGQETFRRSGVKSIKAICSAMSVQCIDRDSIYTDYTVATGGFKAGLNSNGVHPNLAGHTLEAAMWSSIIMAL